MNGELVQILETIKRHLKYSGMRYEDLAEKLGISHASVKRLLNGKDIQVSKLVNISKILGINLFELIEQSKNISKERFRFTIEQEMFLSKDFNNFLVLRSIILNLSKEEIRKKLSLSEKNISVTLMELEKLGLIEVFPGDIIKLNVSFPFEWIDSGPLEKAYATKIDVKISNELKKAGINNTGQGRSGTQVHVKEFLLHKREYLNLENELDELVKKYEILTKVGLKSKETMYPFSFASIAGNFSWWES